MKLFAVLSTTMVCCTAVRVHHKGADVEDQSVVAQKEQGRGWVFCPCDVCCKGPKSEETAKFTCLLDRGRGTSAPANKDCGEVKVMDESFVKTVCSFNSTEQYVHSSDKLEKSCDKASTAYLIHKAQVEAERAELKGNNTEFTDENGRYA